MKKIESYIVKIIWSKINLAEQAKDRRLGTKNNVETKVCHLESFIEILILDQVHLDSIFLFSIK